MVRSFLNRRGCFKRVKSPDVILIFLVQESKPSFHSVISCSPAESSFEIFVSLKSCFPSITTFAPVGNDSICAIPFCSNLRLAPNLHPSTTATNTKTNPTTASDIIISTKMTLISLLRLRFSISILSLL